MYAIISDRGRQYRAEVGARLVLDRAASLEPGASIETPVLFLCDADKGETTIGTPFVEGRKAVLRVIGHTRGGKGIAGTYKRRKDTRRRVGFRADQTTVEVVEIS